MCFEMNLKRFQTECFGFSQTDCFHLIASEGDLNLQRQFSMACQFHCYEIQTLTNGFHQQTSKHKDNKAVYNDEIDSL